MTRRRFLQLVSQVGGASAVYGAIDALGLGALAHSKFSSGAPATVPAAAPAAVPATAPTERFARRPTFALNGDAGRKRTVIILGAGVAGLCAAYELGKAGYDCTIFEGRTRVGGRAHTIQRGVIETETDGRSQTCAFDAEPHLYFNPGATRIPQYHLTIDYCRELGVAIEPWGNLNEGAYLFTARGPLAGKRVRMREARADLYGYVSELLAKAVQSSDLDQRLTPDDKQKLMHYLAIEGGLSGGDLAYHGGNRRGYKTWPGAGATGGVLDDPLPLAAIIESGFGTMFSFNWGIEQQSQMFQIVGGTERFPEAFARHVGRDSIELGARVLEIRQTANDVTVAYVDRLSRPQRATAEFCVCTIPPPVLKDIPIDCSEKMKDAIAHTRLAAATKVGIQFKRRFWEEDDQIFSGITRTDQSITQIMYPSCGYLGKKGVVVGCYNYEQEARDLGDRTPAERIEIALQEGSKIHPQYREEYESAMSVAWHKTPFSLGAYTMFDAVGRSTHYPRLCEPDGRIYLAGEHVSWLNGWMAGALESARRAVTLIHDRASQQPSTAHAGG